MPQTFTKNSFSSTYKDDWAEPRGYQKVLFRGGRALQARELNEIQSILNAEIKRLGSHLFKDGAMVNPGSPTVNNRLDYVRLDDTGGQVTKTHVGQTITGATSGVQAVITKVVYSMTGGRGDPSTLFVKYVNDGSNSATAVPVKFTPGEVLTAAAGNLQVEAENFNPKVYPTGRGSSISTTNGDFFVLGRFVNAPAQTLILSKYNNRYTGTIGFKVLQDIVTVDDNSQLYDNQGGTPNLSSPGADRYRIRLALCKKEMLTDGDNFVFLCKMEKGEIVQQVDGTDDYNKINDLLAKRTFEESGNYIAKPFKAKFEYADSAITDKYFLSVSPGTAYINGYRANIPTASKLIVPKPTATETITDDAIAVSYNQYVTVNPNNNKNLPPLNTVLGLKYLSNGGGASAGYVIARAIERQGDGNLRLQVYSIGDNGLGAGINDGDGFRNVASIGTGSTNYFNVVQTGTPAKTQVLGSKTEKAFLFPLPNKRPQQVGTGNVSDTNISFTVQRELSGTANASGNVDFSLSATGETFVNISTNFVASADSAVRDSATFAYIASDPTQLRVGNLLDGTTYNVLAFVQKANATERTKTLTNTTATGAVATGDTFQLGLPDVHEINSIKDSANGNNIANYFTLDKRITESFYGQSVLLNTGRYSGPVYVDFDYFARGAGGDFYSVNSYIGIDYKDIPTQQFFNIPSQNMRNVIDFRPDRTVDSAASPVTNAFESPVNGNVVTADVSYYLPRADKLVVNQDGSLSYHRGKAARIPQFVKTPDGALPLYKIVLQGNTLTPKDVKLTPIISKRYTMADIAALDRKLERLEEVVSLSLLELDTKNTVLLNNAGDVRTTSGFFVDNFSDHVLSNVADPQYKASIDLQGRLMRPTFNRESVSLKYNNTLSSNAVKKGDNVYINYREVQWNSVLQASKTEMVNPFLVPNYVGSLLLSPASDEWKDVVYDPDKAIDGGVRVDATNATSWNEDEWSWAGVDPANLEVGAELQRSNGSSTSTSNSTSSTTSTTQEIDGETFDVETTETTTTTNTSTPVTVTTVVSNEVVTEVVNDRVVQTAFIPWIRSRLIYFKAEGLRPNTQMFAFFDDRPVANWVKSESSFVRWSDRDDEKPQYVFNQTEHPDGKSTLTTDSKGELIGSFWIPNTGTATGATSEKTSGPNQPVRTDVIRFATGIRQFKLLDISVNTPSKAICRAEATYTAQGVLETRQQDVVSTRYIELADTTQYVNSSSVTSTSSSSYTQIDEDDDDIITEVTDTGLGDGTASETDYDSQNPTDRGAGDQSTNSDALIEDPVAPVVDEINPCDGLTDGACDAIGYEPGGEGAELNAGFSGSWNDAGLAGGNLTFINAQNFAVGAYPIDGTFPDQTLIEEAGAVYTTVQAEGQLLIEPSLATGDVVGGEIQYYPAVDNTGLLNPSVFRDPKDDTTNEVIYYDPIAQTFNVDNAFGVFLTKVDLYFATKDTSIPVQVQIRPTVNGVPASREIVPGSRVTVAAADVQTPIDTGGLTSVTMSDVLQYPTSFEFEEPIFLQPYTEYAIVVVAPNTVAYKVYVSEVEQFEIGSTSTRITQQPSLGSFFKSQNAKVWEPAQKLDLMHKLHRADFSKKAEVFLENRNIPSQVLFDGLLLDSSSSTVTVNAPGHGLRTGDRVYLGLLDSETRYGGILGSSMLPKTGRTLTVSAFDANNYQFAADSAATRTGRFGNRFISRRNISASQALPTLDHIVPTNTQIAFDVKFTSGSSYAGNDAANRFSRDATFTRFTPGTTIVFDSPKLVAQPHEEQKASREKSTLVKVSMSTPSRYVSPVLDMQRASFAMTENLIDNQVASTPNNTQNVPILYVDETDANSGSSIAKHITKPVTLIEDATGLKVLVAANVPTEADFEVYYRTYRAADGDLLDTRPFVKVEPENVQPKDANKTIFREYEYLIGGTEGTLNEFTQFQLKIVMKSSNVCKVPRFRDLRAIALVD